MAELSIKIIGDSKYYSNDSANTVLTLPSASLDLTMNRHKSGGPHTSQEVLWKEFIHIYEEEVKRQEMWSCNLLNELPERTSDLHLTGTLCRWNTIICIIGIPHKAL